MADKTVVYRLLADVTTFRAQMAQASASVRETADRMTGATREGAKFRAGLTTVGTAAGKFGLVAAAGLGAAVIAAANFDQAMSKVQAATHDSSKNMDLLRQAAIDAGQKTVFSATEAASAIEEMAKAGVSTKDILNGGLNAALSLASAGTIEVGQAAEIAATTMNQFGLAGKDVGHIADVLAAAAGKAQGGVTDMAEALKYVGPIAHQMGISLNQTVGAIAELASQGILGSQAGTSLRGMLSSLTSPSKQAAKVMKDLGITVYDAKGNFVGFDGVAQQLQTSMSGLTNAERDQALGRIFGNQQLVAARILYAGGAQAVDAWTKKVNDSGYAATTAAMKMNNLKGDLEQLRGSLETALIGTGEGSQGPLRSFVQDLTSVVNAYIKLPEPAKQATGTILGFTAAAGGSIWAVSHLVTGVASMRETMSNLGGSFSGANKGMLAFRAASAAAGVGLLAIGAQVDDTHHTLGTLAKAAGGAALGFSVGGPWGAAIGGGISLLSSLAGAAGNAAGEEAALTATLNQQTGAITGNTKQWVAQKLETDGVLANAQHLGISLGTVTKAALGNGNAMAQLNRVLKDYMTAARAAGGGNTPEYRRVKDMQALIEALKHQRDQINGVVQARKREILASESAHSVMQALQHSYNLTPKQVRTAILQDNMGQSQAAIARLLHTYGLTPKQVATFLKTIDQASPVLQRVRAGLNALNGATANTYVVTHYNKQYGGQAGGGGHTPPGLTQANGGILDFYAKGGIRERHVAQIAPAGAWRVWAEPETGGEAYIPLAPSKRDRSRAIAAEVVSRLGGHVQFANGGIVGGGWSSAPGRVTLAGPMEISGPVAIRGKVDVSTGQLIGSLEGPIRVIARQEVDDAADFSRTMGGRHS